MQVKSLHSWLNKKDLKEMGIENDRAMEIRPVIEGRESFKHREERERNG